MIGTTLSHYEVLERLGGGGMGVVYKARDLRLDRLVALKLLSPARATTPEDRRRFFREARAASALEHPNLCTLYEIGEAEDGRPFLAMAFCPGETLKERLARGPLPVAEAVDVADQIAAGLAAAHERGIVHRDVKPANVIVSPAGIAKLVDFGIAKLADAETRLTRAGTALGTAAYMAPEQLRGAAVDARADLWSLGVVLYEMIAGHNPFAAASEEEAIRAILHRDPRPLGLLVPGLPPGLDAVVARALARNPEARYARAEELRRDLLAAAAATPAPPAPPAPPDARPATRSPTTEETLIDLPASASRVREAAGEGPAGRAVGPYRLAEPLGGGGMGVVYRAEDTRLGRTVALKLLAPELTRDPDAKARFLQEARAASALDHPNLCTILDVGETAAGQLFLAMPCYDGETLAARIARGPLPPELAADVARQAAQGLAKAHRHGIVHRDVKPANLILTADGVVKILDFGIAKLAGAAGLTRLGGPLGTPAYMAPEQARGQEVGPAADVWSLGVVLYEMLAGRRPFRGEGDQAVLYAVCNEEPEPLRKLRADVPPGLERIVGRMLAKDPGERYPGAPELLADLAALTGWAPTGQVPFPPDVARARRRPRRWLAAAAALLALALAGSFLLGRGDRDDRGGPSPLQATFTRMTDLPGREVWPSLAPAGDFFLYVSDAAGNLDVYLQRIGGGNPINLTADSPADDTEPAFSPDGRQIAFRSERDGGGIFLMGATGESVRRLTDFCHSPAWSPDVGRIACATEGVLDPTNRTSSSQVWIVDVATGARRRLVPGDALQPSWSPDGRRIAYWGIPAGTAQRVLWTVPADGGEPVRVTDDAYVNWSPVWSPDGRALYFASNRSGPMNLWRVPVDQASGEVLGAPGPVTTPSEWSGPLSVSKDGRRILYASYDGRANLERVPFDPRTGEVAGPLEPITRGAKAVRFATASPDGRWLAFDTSAPQEDLFVVQPDGGGLRQLTDDPFKDRYPRWSPDSSRLVFYSNRSGRYEAWSIRLDGSGLEPLTRTEGDALFNPNWGPDGRWLAVNRGFAGAELVDLSRPLAERRPVPLPFAAPSSRTFSVRSWSRDGRLLSGELHDSPESAPAVGIYSFAERRSELLVPRGRDAVFLPGDDERLLYLDGGAVHTVDRRTRQVRQVLASPPHSSILEVTPGPDGRALYVVRARHEGDIWMLSWP